MDQTGYVGNPDFIAAANGETPAEDTKNGVGTDSLAPMTRPTFGRTRSEGRVKGSGRH